MKTSSDHEEIAFMSEQNMKIVQRLLEEVWTQGKLPLMPELVAQECVSYPMPHMGAVRGCEEYRNFIAVYKGIFLDMSFEIQDQFASGDKVATRWISRVTDPSGDATQDTATGEQLSIDGITLTHHDATGKIVAEWATWDTQSLLQSTTAPQVFEQLSIKV
jgi:predicted ester cyclase